MSLTILDNRASIEAAIATMHPVAKEAAQLLAHRIFAAPDLIHNNERLCEEWLQSCAISARRAGMNDEAGFSAFIERHGEAVLNIAVSIVVYSVKAQERRRKWGLLGKVAAVAAGVVIGSFFG